MSYERVKSILNFGLENGATTFEDIIRDTPIFDWDWSWVYDFFKEHGILLNIPSSTEPRIRTTLSHHTGKS